MIHMTKIFVDLHEHKTIIRISGAQARADGEARILGVTMTVRVDIFTKAVTSSP